MTKKPEPLIPITLRERCPVCGEFCYSTAGIHPQCAVKQADQKRMQRIKSQPKIEKKASQSSDLRPWQKICPKCKAVAHIRKKDCNCGHLFAGHSRPPAESSNT